MQKSIVDPKEVKVKIQEPPSTTQTTKLLLLPPPSPPRAVTDALQVPRAATRDDAGKQEQLASTPQTIECDKNKNKKKRKKQEMMSKL